jgi:F-type H+-transporting ATPase subunit b
MPQLDASTYLPQLVWLAVTFTVLFVLMTRFGLPPVGAVIEQRRSKIAGDLDAAQQLKDEAETVMATYERALAEARHSAQEMLRETTDRLNAEAEKRQRETARILQQEIGDAERSIAAARTAALADLQGAAAEVARVLAQKLSGAEIGAQDAAVAVEAVLSERA